MIGGEKSLAQPDPPFLGSLGARSSKFWKGGSGTLVLSPDPTFERGSGDIQPILRASLTLIFGAGVASQCGGGCGRALGRE